MEIRETGIAGLLVIKPKIFEDERGYFFESFKCVFVFTLFEIEMPHDPGGTLDVGPVEILLQ